MKKFIASLLTIAMLFSLTACGGETMLSSGISVNIKGSGKKEMKVSVIDQFEDLDYDLNYIVDTNEDPVYQVTLTKDEAHEHKYSVTGCKAGTTSWTIQYVVGDQVYAGITMDITVNDALHVFYSNVTFSDVRKAEEITLVDDVGNEIKTYISVEETGYKIIQLENSGGWWNIGEYDEGILDVTQKEIEDDDTSSTFIAEAIGTGTTFLYFQNPDIDTQVVFDITVTAKEGEEGGFILIVNDYTCGPMEHITTEEMETVLSEIEEEFGKTEIPAGAYIKGAGYTNGTEGFADIEFMVNRELLTYTIIRGETAASLANYTTTEMEVIKDQKIKIGTHDARYLYLEGGVCIVFWDEENQAIRVSFYDMGKDSEEYEDWFAEHMPPVYDTKTSDAAVKAGN